MTAVRIKRMYKTNMHGHLSAITVVLIARNSRGQEIMSKIVTGKVGTPWEPGDYVLDVGGKAATQVNVVHPDDKNITLEWKLDQ